MSDERGIQPDPEQAISLPGRPSRLVSRGLQHLERPRRRLTMFDNFDNYSFAESINSRRQIVGYAYRDRSQHAMLWQGGQIHDLGTLGDSKSSAVDINDLGQVVGEFQTLDGWNHTFIWDHGIMRDIHPSERDLDDSMPKFLEYGWSRAEAINNSGQVLCSLGTSEGVRALLWEDGHFRLMNTPHGRDLLGIVDWPDGRRSTMTMPIQVDVRATDINDAGQVVGSIYLRFYDYPHIASYFLGFCWEEEQTFYLDDVAPEAINNLGQIIGTTAGMWGANRLEIPFVEMSKATKPPAGVELLDVDDKSRSFRRLFPNYKSLDVSGINNLGQVVGWATGVQLDSEQWPYEQDNEVAVPFLWENGQMQPLVSLDEAEEAGFVFPEHGETLVINDNGQIAGTALDERKLETAFGIM